ncbi:MAG: restriction endonuclease [Lachnospiraceae bacterium]
MLNYANLNDVEFEYLCQDIMSHKLGVNLRRFAAGKDGGIDLTDSTVNPQHIVQVKHYVNTDISGLLRSLRKEIKKVKALNPVQYYICCSKQLSPPNISEIYTMFSDYMETEENIITLTEIEDFLTDSTNIGVLRKHYKLWISSMDILRDLHNTDIFIDCDSLVSNIQKEEKYFVQTIAYNQALKCLSKNKTLFLTGDPGVGKTVTSKMLILNFAAIGYRVRYTTDVTDLAALKRSLIQDRDAKEVILLDDCFGQAYFEMKSTQGTELLSLIRFVNASKNKCLILNSRITIYQEARKRTPELVKSFENEEYKVQIINMSAISELEKAKILYNHMYFSTVNEIYFQAVKSNKNYLKIIRHKNYNPRIIEFISNPNRYSNIPPNQYYKFVKQSLDTPHQVWDNEYEDRIQAVDRCLLITLYSLTNTTVSYELVKACFVKRICNECGIDTTVNQFERSLARLQESFIRIVDEKGVRKLSMINPSVNDYLKARLENNPLELERMLNAAAAVPQYHRLLPADQADIKIRALFEIGQICEFYFEYERQKTCFIVAYIAKNSIMNLDYKNYVYQYMEYIDDVFDYNKNRMSAAEILTKLFDKSLFHFYNIDSLLTSLVKLHIILCRVDFETLPEILSVCYPYFEQKEGFIEMCEEVIAQTLSWYCNSVDASSFGLNIGKVVDKHIYLPDEEDDFVSEIDRQAAIIEIDFEMKQILENEIDEILSRLPEPLRGDYTYEISIEGIEGLVDDYLGTPLHSDDRIDRMVDFDIDQDIDLIFNR